MINKPELGLFLILGLLVGLLAAVSYWDTRNMSEEDYGKLVAMQQKLRSAPRDSFITIRVSNETEVPHYETYVSRPDGIGVYLGSSSNSHQFNSKYLSYNNVWRGPSAHYIVTDICYPEHDCWKPIAEWFFLQ